MPHLSTFAHVMAPDFHGYGRSDPLPDQAVWWHWDREIVLALAELTGTRVHVVGHSLGGAAAFYAAMHNPDCIASLTVIEPVLFGLLEQAGLPEFSDASKISARLWSLIGENEMIRAAEEFTDFWSGPGTFAALQPHQSAYIVDTIARVGDDWRGLSGDLNGQITLHDIEAFDHPVHLIKGSQSRLSGQRIVDLLSERLPRTDLTVIPEADHLGAVTRPDLFIPAIVSWLKPRVAT